MNIKNLIYKNILKQSEKRIKFGLGLISSFLVLLLFYFSSDKPKKPLTGPDSSMNLTVMIPDGYVLFGFEAENYELISPILAPYSMVKVYKPHNGKLLAQNIKVLRAPKDPSQLSFLVPVKIANYFASFGLEYRIVIQKYDIEKKPELIQDLKRSKTSITYGGLKK